MTVPLTKLGFGFFEKQKPRFDTGSPPSKTINAETFAKYASKDTTLEELNFGTPLMVLKATCWP